MKKKNLFISLVFPAIMIANGIICYRYWFDSYNEIAKLMPYPIMICGILSFLITIFAKVDTSKHIKLRTVFLLISFTLFELPEYLFLHIPELDNPSVEAAIFYALLWCIVLSPVLLLIIELVLLIKRKAAKKELIVILLCNKHLAGLIAVGFVFAELAIRGL